MKIFVKEITDQEKKYHFTSGEHPWVLKTTAQSDETPPLIHRPRPETSLDFSTQLIDEVYVTGGTATGAIHVICSRCATPFYWNFKTRFQSLFSADASMAGVSKATHTPHGRQRSGVVDEDNDDYKSDIALLTQDFIDLSAVLSEQIELERPFQPLCTPTCKGICQHCGADLNKGRCACDKIRQDSPFLVLKDLSKKPTKARSK